MFRIKMNPPLSDEVDPTQLSNGEIIIQGLRKAVSGAVWVYKILVPISFLTLLLQFSGVLERLEGILGPVMGLIHLPAKAAMPLVAGFLTGIYGGVASMAVIGFSARENALIAIFLLISHNMIQESAVQGKAGINPIKAALFRICASILVVWILGFIWAADGTAAIADSASALNPAGFGAQLVQWGYDTLILCVKILGILICIMTAITWMKARRISQRIVHFIIPVLRGMGLGSREGLLWLTAILFGVTYGSAVIIEETRQGGLTREELERLHLSIGINHAMIEDPALFLPLGIHPFWLWIPRLIMALIAVHCLRIVRFAIKKRIVNSEC
jgi:spore maturation protein SpmB